MKVLLAEDDTKLGILIKHMLEQSHVQVDWVVSGDMALECALYETYDVVVLDWMMPVQDGITVCNRLRKEGYHGAILMLTAKDSVEDRVLGLDTGADDYIVKPFEFAELIARLRALARRSNMKLDEDILQVGNLVVNRLTHCVQRQNVKVQFTCREFQLLDILIRNQKCVVPRDVILDRVWGLEADISSNNLDVYIRLLRKKMRPFEDVAEIKTIRGIGYKLEVQDVY